MGETKLKMIILPKELELVINETLWILGEPCSCNSAGMKNLLSEKWKGILKTISDKKEVIVIED